MTKILVIQGAGMNMRGKTQIEQFGPMTLEQMNESIRDYARSLEVEVDILHSNLEGEVVNALYAAHDGNFDAVLLNPAGFLGTTGPLPNAIAQIRLPTIEIHASNPATRGLVSTILPACRGSITGMGIHGYYLGLLAAKRLVDEDFAST